MQISSTMLFSNNSMLSLLLIFLSIDLCQAGIYRYRKNAHSTEPAHKLRHSTSGYNRNCFFSPVNCVSFFAEPGFNASSLGESDVKLVEYHKSGKTIKRYNNDDAPVEASTSKHVDRRRRSARKPKYSV